MSKFLTLIESVHDVGDLYTSLSIHQWFLFAILPVVLCAILNVESQGIVMSYGAKILDVLKDLSMQRNLHRYVEDIMLKH